MSWQSSRDIPGSFLFKPPGKQTFELGHELFDHHPLAWKTSTPPGGLWTQQKVNLCALFSCLISLEAVYRTENYYLGVSQRTPDPNTSAKSIAIQMGGVSWYKLVVYILLSARRRAYFCKRIAIEMGGVPRYFSQVSGSGVDVDSSELHS